MSQGSPSSKLRQTLMLTVCKSLGWAAQVSTSRQMVSDVKVEPVCWVTAFVHLFPWQLRGSAANTEKNGC